MDIPVVDLSLPEAEAAVVLGRACRTVGFFYAINHGVPDALVAEHFAQSRAFFSQPEEAKRAVLADRNNRGFTPMKEETLDPANQSTGDTKEGYYICREAEEHELHLPLHGPNVWPAEGSLPGWRAAQERYFDACRALGLRLVRLVALALGLPADHFDANFALPMLALRLLHYAPTRSDPGAGVFGAGAHSDYGMLTLLRVEGGVPGLQIRRDGTWLDVPEVEGAFIVNLGDMLERWTNGAFASTVHRVVLSGDRERYSTAFFIEPNFLAKVECLPQCCSPENPARWPPTTSGEHILAKYRETHADFKE